MLRFYKITLLSALFVLIFSTCAASSYEELTAEELFMEDIDSIVADIQAMYDDYSQQYLHELFLNIAFADIDFDGIPEFFYGYQTITGAHNKIWYRAYSLRDRVMISTEHSPNWHTYIADDKQCAFFTGPESFLERNIITQTYAGSATDIRLDVNIIQYKNSKLFVNTVNWSEVNWHDESLLPLKQVWASTKTDRVKADAIKLLNEYSAA